MSCMFEKQMFDKNDAFALRGWCILLIILHHLLLFYGEKYGVSLPRWTIELRSILGYAVVGTFFMLSGYGIYHSIVKNRPLSIHYWIRRLLKLYLPYVFVVLAISILEQIIADFEVKELWQSLATLSLPTEELWFMKTIVVFHILSYALLGYLRRPHLALVIISALTLAWMIIAYYFIGLNGWKSHWCQSLWCFPIGLWLALYCDKLSKLKPVVWLAVVALFTASYLTTLLFHTHYAPESLKYALSPWAYNFSAMSFALLFIRFVPMLGTRSKLLNYCGHNSWMLYLGHVGLLQLFTPKSVMLFTILVVTVAFALTALYNWINNHCLYKLTQ